MTRKYISNKDETVRMFESNFMETLSKVHPSVPVIIFVPVILYSLYSAIVISGLSFATVLGLAIFGLFIWSITEYTLHRFVFHMKLTSPVGRRIHFIFHGVHHDYPNDSRRLVMPPSVSLPLAAMFYLLFYYLIGSKFVFPFFAGFITGYLVYDMTHYAIHHFNMHSKFLLAIKKHHIKHHYQNEDKGFGVSSPFWDLIFDTHYFSNNTKTNIVNQSEQNQE
jgi:4-hydroxysphinganine ceramide fatty acyl 2-hydroxylase